MVSDRQNSDLHAPRDKLHADSANTMHNVQYCTTQYSNVLRAANISMPFVLTHLSEILRF